MGLVCEFCFGVFVVVRVLMMALGTNFRRYSLS